MARLGLNVPPGLVISTSVCQQFYDAGKRLPAGLLDEVKEGLRRVEDLTGSKFGDAERPPLLLSVRSGAAVSMPVSLSTPPLPPPVALAHSLTEKLARE